ncbi:hypothetical protein EMPS_04548 [Entomortierella parvispora]|uniref:F-box domain-containing protein n=1 Tax=Entomortierella parvispora TaxID=205924 RepID=A0A9P3LVI0_9FUNG|nr:hypothetical protein EMPS_04548 [Entomortierella parvispora]
MSLRRIKRTFHRHFRPDRYIVVSPSEDMSCCDPCPPCSNDARSLVDHANQDGEEEVPPHPKEHHQLQPHEQHLQQRRSIRGTSHVSHLPHPTLPSGTNHVERSNSSCRPCVRKNVATRPHSPPSSTISHVNNNNKVQDDNDNTLRPACAPFPHQPQQQQQQQHKSKQNLTDVQQGRVQTQTNSATMDTTTAASDHPLSWKQFVNHHHHQHYSPKEEESLGAQDQDHMALSTTLAVNATAASILGPRLPPYYVSCFSPLDLPVDVFVYLLDFLSPGDLWKLCQVSSTMGFEVRRYMTGPQRFGFEAVRILYRRDELEARAEMEAELRREFDRMEQEERLARLSVSSSSPSPGAVRPAYHGHLMPYLGQTQHHNQQQLSPLQQHGYHLRSYQGPYLAHSPQHRSTSMEPRKLMPTRSESRSTYWSAQAIRFLNLMAKGLPVHLITPPSRNSMLGMKATGNDGEVNEGELDNGQACERDMMLSPRTSLFSSPSSASPSTVSLRSGSSSVSLVEADNNVLGDWRGPLPLKRFQAIVNLLFDPNLVVLHHRRAVINCARYVTASIEDGFGKASKTQDPVDAVFAEKMHQDCSVVLGPFLHILSPVIIVQTSNSLSSSAPNASVRRTRQSVVKPPTRMSNYFQLMLWHRCLSDLVALYNRIQQHHSARPTLADPSRMPIVLPTPLVEPLQQLPPPSNVSSASLSATPQAPRSRSNSSNSYPCSCASHSTAFASQYPYTIVPNVVRNRFRQAIQRLWLASMPQRRRHRPHRRPLLCLPFASSVSEELNAGDSVRRTRRDSRSKDTSDPKQRSCPHGVHGAVNAMTESASPTVENEEMDWEHQQQQQQQQQEQQQEQLRRALEEEALVYQQYRSEERIRQDNLLKQELLSLCHMACGLFLSDDNRSSPLVQALNRPQELHSARMTPTIMTLLREQGPWSKGVWREGEWRRSPVQVEDEIDEITINLHQQQQQSSSVSSCSSSSSRANKTESTDDQGPWQRLCLATIDFLSSESLYWGGNQTNAELSKLRAASLANAWIYHE